MFWQKQENIEQLLDQYFDGCDECFELFEKAMDIFFTQGLGEQFENAVLAVHSSESKADDRRREIEYLLYGKALLPESRGDILGLLETYDRLPNIAETVLFVLSCQQTTFPEPLVEQFKLLVKLNVESYRLARKAVDALMTNPKSTLSATKEVDHKESESDRVERELVRDIFKRDDDTGVKLLYKEYVILIGNISDRAEKVADRIGIIAIKRQI
jgi:predicted phosphate transport protein (TIGR00153 family)